MVPAWYCCEVTATPVSAAVLVSKAPTRLLRGRVSSGSIMIKPGLPSMMSCWPSHNRELVLLTFDREQACIASVAPLKHPEAGIDCVRRRLPSEKA